MTEITKQSKCTGCSTCYNICPKNCISMVFDGEGFLRPLIDSSLCINCNLCKNSCPVNIEQVNNGIIKSIGANAKNTQLRSVSSSGGIFSLIAQRVLETNGIVFGAGFSDDFQSIKHMYIDNADDLYKLRTSKYVQSTIGNTYSQVKEFLLAKRKVLFCGTPCQIAGLKAFLGKEYDSLITLDFICHGVPSPRVWTSYINHRKEQLGEKIQNVFFRNKQNGWRKFSLRIDAEGGKYYLAPNINDLYLKGFCNDLILRPSCYDCDFKGGKSGADITVADFWSIDSVAPELNDDSGMSILLIHTEEGMKILSEICDGLNIIEITEEQALKNNPSYYKSVSIPKTRESFFRYAKKKGDVAALTKYARTTLIITVKVIISSLLKFMRKENGKKVDEKS